MAHTNSLFYPIMDLWSPNVNPPYLTFSARYGPFDFGVALGMGQSKLRRRWVRDIGPREGTKFWPPTRRGQGA